MTDPLIVVRGVHFAGTLVACGTVGFIHLVAEPAKVPSDGRPLRNRLSVLTLLALAVAILSGAAWLVLLAGGHSRRTAPRRLPARWRMAGPFRNALRSRLVRAVRGSLWYWHFLCFGPVPKEIQLGSRRYCCACLRWLAMQVRRLA
jgi:hypothetical protein